MNMYFNFQFYLLTGFSYIQFVKSVVPEYCLQPLNRSDCGLKPTAVMTYWRPGSRCEVDYWRGCPTYNKFVDEYECSLHCIFKMSNAIEDHSMEQEVLVDDCEATLNQGHCLDILEAVYTYDNGTCVKKKWRGCPSQNKFDNQNACEQACGKKDWESKLEDLDVEELKTIVELIDEVAIPITPEQVTTTTKASTTTTIEPTTTTTEPTTTTTEPTTTTTEPTTTTTESTTTTTEPTTTTTESTTTTTEPTTTTTEPTSTTTEPTTTTTEPTTTTTEPTTTTTEPTSSTTTTEAEEEEEDEAEDDLLTATT